MFSLRMYGNISAMGNLNYLESGRECEIYPNKGSQGNLGTGI